MAELEEDLFYQIHTILQLEQPHLLRQYDI